MAKLSRIKRQITLIREIQRITNTMKTISAARLRMGKSALEKARVFGEQLSRLLELVGFREVLPEVPKSLLVGIFPDRGLVGAFSDILAQNLRSFLKTQKFEEFSIIVLGSQGKRALRELEPRIIASHPLPVHQVPHYRDVRELTYSIFQMKDHGVFTHLYVSFMRYISLSEQKPVVERLLPPAISPKSSEDRYLFLSDVEHLYHTLLFEHVAGKLYQALAESFMSEQATRFLLMDTATTHARETLEALSLLYAKKRQESITQELNEVTGAAEALRKLEEGDIHG
ncbi:F0F1 ATP synthase subunit gamma [Candidatus Caldatribacterium saccharofermentans]|uniref:F0F1 ATP synthase subunit gamma n=1 Tax=Candidatus Caldatribacterium saccharofermentans TaxID=1454753 RepID=A0A7V4TGS8_9BACT